MPRIETVVGLATDDRVTYWVRDWAKYDSETGTIPQWEEHSYDPNDPALAAWLADIADRKDEIRTAMEALLSPDS